MTTPSMSSKLKAPSHVGRTRGALNRSENSQTHEEDADSLKQQSGGDGAKRRSFLPQRGLPKPVSYTGGSAGASTLKSSLEDVANEPADVRSGPNQPTSSQPNTISSSRQGRLPPRSLYQPSPAQQVTRRADDMAAPSQHVRSADTAMKPPPSTVLGRSQSLRRPGVPAPATQAPSRSHTRTQSTTIARKPNGENTTHTERPKSMMIPPARLTKPVGDVPSDGPAAPARTSARLEALKRSTSTRARPDASSGHTSVVSSSHSSDTLPPHGRPRDNPDEGPKKLARPAFSTLQQHFTPRKTAKAPTSAFLHPVNDTSTQSLPSETVSLQFELLQLHLLHESSGLTGRQWELSARRSLRTKFDEVASLYEVMRENERLGQEQKNLLAFREWNGANTTSGLVEHIQALSGPLHELPALMEPGSRLTHLVEDFDAWLSEVKQVWQARNNPRGGNAESKSLAGLGDAWEEQIAVLTRKLTAFSRDLDRLPQPVSASSSLACTISACRQLLEGLLAELQMMRTIELDVVAREKRWIEERLRLIAQDVGLPVVPNQPQAWRL